LAEGDAELAAEAAAELDDPVARDIVEWTRLRRGGAEFDDYVAFSNAIPTGRACPISGRRANPRCRAGAMRTASSPISADNRRAPGMGALALANAHMTPRQRAGRARRGDGGLDRA
jgi:hypothetical protein